MDNNTDALQIKALNLSVILSFRLSNYSLGCLSVFLFLSASVSNHPSVFLPVYIVSVIFFLFVYFAMSVCIFLSKSLSIGLFTFQSIFLSSCQSISVFLSSCLYLCLSNNLFCCLSSSIFISTSVCLKGYSSPK